MTGKGCYKPYTADSIAGVCDDPDLSTDRRGKLHCRTDGLLECTAILPPSPLFFFTTRSVRGKGTDGVGAVLRQDIFKDNEFQSSSRLSMQ
jgi:hypothetical protein